MKDNLKFALLIIGIICIFFIMGREIAESKAQLKKAQYQIAQEKKEKVWLKDELEITRSELMETDRNLRAANNKLGFVNKKIMALRYNNAELIKTRHDLENKISELTEEKKIIESKFSSLIELKKAIRQVKIEIRSEKIKQKKEKIRQQKEIDKWETARGNKGFFTRGGEEYYKPKVKVEVRLEDANLNKKAP